MKNISFFKFVFLFSIVLNLHLISYAQNDADIVNEDPPENLYVVPIGMATWDPIINNELQSYKVWLNNAFVADVDTIFFQFNEDDLVSGETYFAEIQALYNSGLSDKIGFEFIFLPCDSFPSYPYWDIDGMEGNSNMLFTWSENSGKSNLDVTTLGANIYIENELIAFVPNPDTFYIYEEPIPPGYFDYCITKVYSDDDGVHTWNSCIDLMCIQDAGYPDNCFIPLFPSAARLDNDPNIVKLEWTQGQAPYSEWLQYDGVIGFGYLPGLNTEYTIQWAIKFLPEDLEPFNIGYVQKIAASLYETSNDYATEVRIYTGDGTNLIYSQDITETLVEGWNEIILNEDVLFSNTDTLWISMYADEPANNSGIVFASVDELLIDKYDYFAFNGSEWTTLNETYGIGDATWPLRAFASTTTNGKSSELSNSKSLKEFLGYNIYRDGDLITPDYITETEYYDTIGNEYTCYEITEVRSFCHSDPSDEVCVDVAEAIEEYENGIHIYPNPAKNYMVIEAKSRINYIKIYNITGLEVLSILSCTSQKTEINIESLNQGLYIIHIETEEGSIQSKMIIQ